MDARIDSRKKEFKKTLDDPRRKREDEQIQIRRVNREAHLSKKRQQAAETGDNVFGHPTTRVGTRVEELPTLRNMLMSNDMNFQYQAATQLRRMLSVEVCAPILEVVHSGVVPRLVELLKCDEAPLLQFEVAWALTNIASGTSEETATIVEAGAIPEFVRLLRSARDEVREQAIWALGNISGDGPEHRNMVLDAGALPVLLEELASEEAQSKLSTLKYGTWTLSNLCRGKPEPPFGKVAPALPVLRMLIHKDNPDILTDACWAISYLSDSSDDSSNKCIDEVINAGVCARLVELLDHPSFLVQTPALRAVGNIVTGDDVQTQHIILQGALPKLRALLSSPRKAIKKEACWAISNITAGNKDQIEEVLVCGIIGDLVMLLHNAEFEVKREAAWAISNASSGGNPRQVEALVKSGCMGPLCDILEVNDTKLVTVALEAIENILKTGKRRQMQEGLEENPYVTVLEEVIVLSCLYCICAAGWWIPETGEAPMCSR
eukprot:Protomagalhaensia_sp_Gyna_25__694@NODE_1325_length_1942_cov_123_619023_g1057_i0_p1_GENE_NODE_1325_length_1942_cov_123_619023_g1057_i0NODE_1325_length_1942_cov_123_619023_g1057_i0_p1_ORF_typecomplete_len492_score92_57Arm/PF00514_23/60Arm/PF00514_23/8_2e11Arm/PF00514_23/1_1e12Arm/PF00514_23/5_4e06Arm/PF00514_23/2_1e05Arm/PF00514_23/1_1e08Arm/PF00514_23/2_6e11Arm/PF00514_23/5_7e08Arm/PF00514_23/0_0004Arm_2/PF04826_13/2_5e14Arm_2/PF04826_13/2_3e10Arm_2/PF04826_13/0_21HEAT_2/PF13646_6/0_00033HEAT_2/P